MNEQPQIKLIVVSSSPEQAKAIATTVGKLGYGVKGKLAYSSETLQQLLNSQSWDLVLVAELLPPGLELVHVTADVKSQYGATPVIAVYDQVDEGRRTVAMRAGARDAVSLSHPELLGLILKREITHAESVEVMTDEVMPEVPAPAPAPAPSHNHSEDERLWIDRIKEALANNRFKLVYQPIVNLNAEPRPSYELLLRMLDEDGTEIPPGAFLPLAEKIGLVKEIDRWVISNAIATLLERHKEEPRTRFFIKLAAASVLDESLISWLSEQMRRAKLPVQCLVFEITESTAIANMERVTALTQQLKQLHALVALDHVGASDANHEASLKTAPDFIKISGQLVRNLSTSPIDRERLSQIVAHARSFGVKTIAQSVQDAGTLAHLWQWGINYIQGYYLQRPEGALSYDFEQET